MFPRVQKLILRNAKLLNLGILSSCRTYIVRFFTLPKGKILTHVPFLRPSHDILRSLTAHVLLVRPRLPASLGFALLLASHAEGDALVGGGRTGARDGRSRQKELLRRDMDKRTALLPQKFGGSVGNYRRLA